MPRFAPPTREEEIIADILIWETNRIEWLTEQEIRLLDRDSLNEVCHAHADAVVRVLDKAA